MFFKRLSRSRSNSQSYVDDYRNDSKANSAYDEKYAQQDPDALPPSSRSIDDTRPLTMKRFKGTTLIGSPDQPRIPRRAHAAVEAGGKRGTVVVLPAEA